MKAINLIFAVFLSTASFAQGNKALPHGTVYGVTPNKTSMLSASKLEAFMGNKTRISATISGQVLKVTKTTGGWFDIDAGGGKVIAAHFSKAGIDIPESLKGKHIIAEGIAQKQFIADDMQHLAGDTVNGKKQHAVKTNSKRKLTFEVKGLMVE